MAFKICLSGTTDVVLGTENYTELEIQSWLGEHQERKPLEGVEGYESWPYTDFTKYVCLNFENGVHTPIHE